MAVRSTRRGSSRDSVKLCLEDPVSRFFRYPLARLLVRGLVRTSITPDQITLIQPFLAAVAAWLIVSDARWRLVLAAVIFEVRSILDCVDGTLARAKKLTSPWGHAIDGLADWLSVLLLYAGIGLHFQAHPPPAPWSSPAVTRCVLGAALLQGAVRSFASDHYKQQYAAIFGGDGAAGGETSGHAASPRGAEAGLFARAEVLILRIGDRVFERAWRDADRGGASTREAQVRELRRDARSPLTRFVLGLWSLSNGDAFVTLVCLSAALGKLWEGQVFFATFGVVWIGGVIAFNGWFVLRAARRGGLSAARAV